METKVTIIKTSRNKETLRLMSLEELVSTIRQGEYTEQVSNLRRYYPLVDGHTALDGTLTRWYELTKNLPRICVAVQMATVRRKRMVTDYNGLVLLEVNNLTSHDEAAAVRQGAAEMPQTLMAFIGADGSSVKIVCRGELFQNHGDTPTLPRDKETTDLFHENLYERARIIYNGQLGVTIEKLEPLPERICYMTVDPHIYYNPLSTPIYARAEKVSEQTLKSAAKPRLSDKSDYDHFISMQTAYEFNLSKAYDAALGITNKDEYRHTVLTLLAQYCMETGIPMATALHLAQLRPSLNGDPQLLNMVFENAYHEEQVRKYQEKKGMVLTRHMSPEALLTMKVHIFLNGHYELRKNVMRGVAEYRTRTGLGFTFQDLTEEARNSITMRALELGIRCWDKDIRRYVNSNDIPLYDPINDYLEYVGTWDGEDRVTPLAQRIPTDYAEWPHLFHIWMRSMVAMWLGKGQLTGNALVPLLIGRQGCGKSSFCRILMPRELMDYYNDRINFKNESDLNLGLTSFGLINLDEFDRVTQRQQIVLKYLVSTAELKYRPPYGKAYSAHRRYASFIGTTNDQTPLTDPSGSRRFICVDITGNIDFQSPVYHDQLYAQLLQEIRDGERYWLTKEEETELMQHNAKFQQISSLGEMILSVVERPKENDEDAQWMSLPELSALLKQRFAGYKEEVNIFRKIGSFMNRQEHKFKSKHKEDGTYYWVKTKQSK